MSATGAWKIGGGGKLIGIFRPSRQLTHFFRSTHALATRPSMDVTARRWSSSILTLEKKRETAFNSTARVSSLLAAQSFWPDQRRPPAVLRAPCNRRSIESRCRNIAVHRSFSIAINSPKARSCPLRLHSSSAGRSVGHSSGKSITHVMASS